MPLSAWQTEDGDIIVWGTHDIDFAKVAMKAAIHDGAIVVEDDFDWEAESDFWKWLEETLPRRLWIYEGLLHEEYWPDWLVSDWERDRTAPIMRFAR